MMAALIFVVSLATLLMFFVSYCRSLMASSSRHPFSGRGAGCHWNSRDCHWRDYARVMQFLRCARNARKTVPGCRPSKLLLRGF